MDDYELNEQERFDRRIAAEETKRAQDAAEDAELRDLRATVTRLTADNERLREALWRCLDGAPDDGRGLYVLGLDAYSAPSSSADERRCFEMAEAIMGEARAALAREGGG